MNGAHLTKTKDFECFGFRRFVGCKTRLSEMTDLAICRALMAIVARRLRRHDIVSLAFNEGGYSFEVEVLR